jgi:hypothetical protein
MMNRYTWRLMKHWAVAGFLGGSLALGGYSRVQAQDPKPTDPPKERKEPTESPDLAKLQKAISDAALKGNIAEVSRLTEQLQRAMKGEPGRGGDGGRGGEAGQPGLPGLPGLPGFEGNQMGRLRDDMLRSLKGFEEAIDNLKGQPEAQDAIRKAMDAYRKAMNENIERMGRMGGFGLGRQANVGELPFTRPGQIPVPRGGTLGVNFTPAPEYVTDLLDLPRGLGMIVQSVNANSPADKAGFKRHDLLLTFGGEEVTNNPGQFMQMVEKVVKSGKPVDAVVFRKGKKETLKGIEMPKEARRDGGEAGGRINFQSMNMSVSDGTYKVNASTKDAKYFVAGEQVDGTNKVNTISVTVGDSKKDYSSIQDVPVEHQAAVRQLLNAVGNR